MVRSVIALFVFAAALCAIIILQPTRVNAPFAVPASAEVTRAPQETLLPPAAAPEAVVPTPQPVALAPVATQDIGPISSDAMPVIVEPQVAAPAAPVVSRSVPQMQPDAPVQASLTVPTSDATLLATTSNILAGLGLEVETLEEPRADRSTAEVLQGIMAGTVPTGDAAMERLVVAALKEGRPDAEIDAMLNAAARAGEVRVPEVLVTADGRVDTAVLLKSIVVQATIAAGGAAPAVPDVPSGDGTGVEVRVVQRAAETEQYRFYTVAPGDSLGAIAVKFYGNATYFERIFEANRGKLSSPNRIMVGQRLVIPDLTSI